MQFDFALSRRSGQFPTHNQPKSGGFERAERRGAHGRFSTGLVAINFLGFGVIPCAVAQLCAIYGGVNFYLAKFSIPLTVIGLKYDCVSVT